MGFAEDLRSPQAHVAVLRLLDSELHQMEVMKKWMSQRAKSEREYSVQLHQMAALVEKLERPAAGLEHVSQLSNVSRDHQQWRKESGVETSDRTSLPVSVDLPQTMFIGSLLSP